MAEAYIRGVFREISANFHALEALAPEVVAAAHLTVKSLAQGGTAFFCGNGGSAADAQHLAAELVGRYKMERRALAAVALDTNVPTITAMANDYHFDEIFERSLLALGHKGDILIGLSTSGNSANVVRAVQAAKEMGIGTIGLTGKTGGKLAGLCDIVINVGGDSPHRIQEMHIAIGHVMCHLIENSLNLS